MNTIILFLLIITNSFLLMAQPADSIAYENRVIEESMTDTIVNSKREIEKANKKIASMGYKKHQCEKMAAELWYKKKLNNQYSVLHIVGNIPFWTESITYASNRYFIHLLNALEEMPIKSLYEIDTNGDFIITPKEYALFSKR